MADWQDIGTGEPGDDGRTLLNGTVAPSGAVGVDGDFYLNTTTNVLYGPKTAGAWGSGVSLIGPQGSQGSQGIQGPAGADGRTILNGTGAPGGAVGVNGDFYLDTFVARLYGPKTAEAWGSGVSLIGPQGPAGTPGTDATVTFAKMLKMGG